MASWTPQPAGLQEILQTIHESTDTRNSAVQRNITHVRTIAVQTSPPLHDSLIYQKLNNFTRAPDYIAYLAYILSAMPQEDDRIRTIAGYLLKNNARLILRAAPDVTAFVKSAVLTAFADPSIMIRNAAAQDIVAFLGILEPKNWPECLQQLVHMLDAENQDQQEVCALFTDLSVSFSLRLGYSNHGACRRWLPNR